MGVENIVVCDILCIFCCVAALWWDCRAILCICLS